MDALKGMNKIGKILEKLTEIEATIEFKRKRGEKPTVDNFLFLGEEKDLTSEDLASETPRSSPPSDVATPLLLLRARI